MSYEKTSGLGVSNHYGPRDTGNTVGVIKTEGRSEEVSVNFDAAVVAAGGPTMFDVVLPASACVEEVYVEVTEAFALGGTTPTILIGTDGSEATNGVVVSKAKAEAVGTYKATLVGTWAAPIAVDTTVGITLGGTSPTITDAGKAKVIVRYTKVA